MMSPMTTFFRVCVLFLVILLMVPSCQRSPKKTANPKKGLLQQQSGCGPSALAMLLKEIGKQVDESELALLAGTDEQGLTSMYGLAQAIKAQGLEAVGYQLSLEELNTVPLPLIAHVKGNHFVVVLAYKPPYLTIIDNHCKLNLIDSDFAQIWKGYVLVIQGKRNGQ